MSMSTYVVGIVEDESPEHKKHSAVMRACVAAGVEKLPKETADFFGTAHPDLDVLTASVERDIPLNKNSEHDGEDRYEILVSAIPPGVTILRFVNSW